MEAITRDHLFEFLSRLGESYPGAGQFYLLGGSALLLLGNQRTTLDVDFTYVLEQGDSKSFEDFVTLLADEMKMDFESVPLGEFIPLPPGAYQRRKWIGRFGNLDCYLFDLYSIALSKIARGFEADLEDVLFMLKSKLIEMDELNRLFVEILPYAKTFDIVQKEFQTYFKELIRRFSETHIS